METITLQFEREILKRARCFAGQQGTALEQMLQRFVLDLERFAEGLMASGTPVSGSAGPSIPVRTALAAVQTGTHQIIVVPRRRRVARRDRRGSDEGTRRPLDGLMVW